MTIEFELNEKSIENAIHRVELYTKDLKAKTRILADKMVEDFKDNAERILIEHVETGETFDSLTEVKRYDSYDQNSYTARVIAGGAAVWLEFGTGVVMNHAFPGEYVHPKALELGMSGLGTFGKGNGANPWGWWYIDESGRRRHTYGIPATMFMYYSAMATRSKIPEMARGVFHT